MKLRKVTWLLAIPVLLLAGGLTAWAWLMHSESGAKWLFARLDASIPGSLNVSTISGDLGSGLRLDGLRFDDGSMRVDLERLKIAIDIDLFPLTAYLDTLHADGIVVRVLQASDQEMGSEKTIQGLSLPVPVNFHDIRISDIEYFDLSGDRALVIHAIEAAGSLHNDLVLDRVFMSLPGNELNLSGRLGLSTLQAPAWELDISSPQLQWPMDDPEPALRLGGLNLHTSGEWPQFTVELSGNLNFQGLETSQLKLAGAGTDGDFRIQHLSLEGPEVSLAATGAFSWQDDLHLLLETDLPRLEPQKWIDDWPENHPVNGDLSVEWSGEELNISSFTLAVANTPMLATGHGVLDTRSGIVDAELNWNDITWPPGDPAPVLNSKSGSFLVSGQLEDWKLEGSLDFQAGEFPAGQVRMSGTGDAESFNITVHEGTVLGGTLAGDVAWNWTQSQPFNAKLALNGIDITPLAPQYSGVLNARLTASGELEPFRLGVELQQLDGVIKGYPIEANGGFHIERNHVYADGLNIRSGASALSLNGSLYEPEGIDFAADIDSLSRFSSEIRGNLAAEGTLSLNPDSPKFIATLSGQQLAFGPVEIARIETRERAGTGTGAGSEVVLSGLMIGQRPIDSLSIHFGGEQPLQRIAISAFAEDTDISVELNGSVNDWADPLTSGWSGALSEFRLDHKGQFILSLEQAVGLELDPSNFILEQACFSGTGDARMCLGSSWRNLDEFSFSADMAAIPVGLLELFIDTDLRFTQLLNGTLHWSQKAGGDRNGDVRIEMSPGAILYADGDEVLLETGPGLFGFDLTGGKLQRGVLDINFPGSGDIDLDYNIPDLSLGRESPIQGTARVDLSDIGAVGEIFPLFDTIDGVLDVDLNLSGTVSDPAFNGRAALLNGHLENRASGFSFSEINLAGQVNEFDRSELKGSFRAGEGTGEISMTVYFEDILAPVVNLTLEGESLTLIDVPELKVIANPDMVLGWQNNTFEINGRLLVPAVRLAPSYLPQSTVRQSEDVVIVAGELPVVEESFLEDNAIKIRGKLEVELGEDVIIELDVAQINVTGMTQFTWQDDVIPIADGSFDATGDIQAYGQFLRITRGRISFPGIPADNPHLNIRAEREIFGNAQIRRAGLMVAGTLRRPVIEAYTVPMTNKHRAQTLLVTGSDFNYEQGVGAVDVGMYVLPRLYISYGIGVFEDGNVLKARFDIGRGFGIRATSGQRETGLDISYTIER